MGKYIDPSPADFQNDLNQPIYVDKSALVRETNRVICTSQKGICVTRPHGFGKTMALDMLAAYYGCEYNTRSLFADLHISKDASYERHLNRYHVIRINMCEFLTVTNTVAELITLLGNELRPELKTLYPDLLADAPLIFTMGNFFAHTGIQFIVLIDNWDCVIQAYSDDATAKRDYLNFLCALLKDQPYVALGFMTGVLPIKKLGIHSGLNFNEYTMLDSWRFSQHFGFTKDDVSALCKDYDMDADRMTEWYGDYKLLESINHEHHITHNMHNPRSVVMSILNRKYISYKKESEHYFLKQYTALPLDSLMETLSRIMDGESVKVQTCTFANDFSAPDYTDDVLTLLVHFGFLSYHQDTGAVAIPNREVLMLFTSKNRI